MTRLIDADELKEVMCRSAIDTREKIESIIDNAPTVTNGTYEQGFRVGAYGRLDELRPHKLPWWAEMFNQEKLKQSQQNIDALRAFEILKVYCKNRECNKDCIFYRELRAGNNIEQFCGLCEIVMSDDKEVKKNETDN